VRDAELMTVRGNHGPSGARPNRRRNSVDGSQFVRENVS